METSNRQLLPNYVLVTSSSEKPLKAPIRSQFDWSLISLWDWNPRVGCLPVAEPQPRSLWVLLLAQGGSFSCGLGWKVVGSPPPLPAKGRHPLWLHLGCCCFAAIVEILNTGALAINKLISAAYKKHLAWNETPSAAHQNWRGLHIASVGSGWCPPCWEIDQVQSWVLVFWFITALRGKGGYLDCQGNVRGWSLVGAGSRVTCYREVDWGYSQMLQGSCESSRCVEAMVGSDIAARRWIGQKPPALVSLWCSNFVYLCCP